MAASHSSQMRCACRVGGCSQRWRLQQAGKQEGKPPASFFPLTVMPCRAAAWRAHMLQAMCSDAVAALNEGMYGPRVGHRPLGQAWVFKAANHGGRASWPGHQLGLGSLEGCACAGLTSEAMVGCGILRLTHRHAPFLPNHRAGRRDTLTPQLLGPTLGSANLVELMQGGRLHRACGA